MTKLEKVNALMSVNAVVNIPVITGYISLYTGKDHRDVEIEEWNFDSQGVIIRGGGWECLRKSFSSLLNDEFIDELYDNWIIYQ